MGQRCECGMATSSLTWCPVFLLEVGSISFLSLLLGSSSKVTPFDYWESFISQVSGTFWKLPPHPPTSLPRLSVSILSAGPQDQQSQSIWTPDISQTLDHQADSIYQLIWGPQYTYSRGLPGLCSFRDDALLQMDLTWVLDPQVKLRFQWLQASKQTRTQRECVSECNLSNRASNF